MWATRQRPRLTILVPKSISMLILNWPNQRRLVNPKPLVSMEPMRLETTTAFRRRRLTGLGRMAETEILRKWGMII